jgi:hypothetical protein
MKADKEKFVCYDCFRLKTCKEPLISWLYFFIAVLAAFGLRAVNVVLDFNPVLAKVFWYTGVGGFLIFFVYKFRYDNIMHRELNKSRLAHKLLSRQELSGHDYEILGTIICKLSSKKDKINYFFIFLSSALALAFAIYVDFFKK